MCGIFGAFFLKGDYSRVRKEVVKMIKRIQARGPDATGLKHYKGQDDLTHHFIGHQRLSIVDRFDSGDQPFYGQHKETCSVTNGEIYNHMELRKTLKKQHTYKGSSDSEIVPHLYDEIEDFSAIANSLSGKFATLVFDVKNERIYVARDHVGVIPCYLGRGSNGEIYVASELKAFHDYATSIQILLPGHYYDSKLNKQIRWFKPLHYELNHMPTSKVDFTKLRDLLIQSVKRRLMCDVPFGVLLSGGLDSSLISSITARLYKEYYEVHKNDILTEKNLCSFCIGLKDSPDIKVAREVAAFLKTKHFEFTFTVEEGIDAISDVIYAVETFNPTTIRASTPMFLMARKIKSLGIKMVLTGEGSDEIFGGYLYFHKAPNAKEFHEETIRKVQDLYKYDLLRGNKSTASWGVEARVPFLDKDFVEYAMNIDPNVKMINKDQNIEKWVLRKAFDDETNPWLPKSVLWRQKEQFSDGVGYSWIDGLKQFINTQVSDDDMDNASLRFPIMTPPTKEAYYYRTIYEEHFPSMSAVCTVPQSKSIACSTEKALEWDESFRNNADESGRSVQIHTNTYSKN